MMGGRGPMPCRFGVDCHRRDCWYSHPAGRAIDAGGGANSGSNGFSRGVAGVGGMGVGGGGMMHVGMMPQASPRMGGSNRRSGGGGGNNECRYSFDCKRQDCHFNHPCGRAIDGDGGTGGRPSLDNLPSNSSVGSVARGMSELSFGSYPPANATDDDQDLKDTWFPKARDCTCCKGYVYGCSSAICESMGQCTCSIEEKDLDGGSDVASNISRTSSPQVQVGAAAGGSTGVPVGRGGEVARPPQPPSEAAMAAAGPGGGGGRPSTGSRGGGGGAECRYGTRCKRANCSFSHPQGRTMDDADCVSFGDFGAGGGGSSAVGKATTTAQQDLMDTWFPDCRECVCCKGYKHGCKTPACAAAGLCACSSGDGPPAPISAVSDPAAASSPEDAPTPAPATGEESAAAAAVGERATSHP